VFERTGIAIGEKDSIVDVIAAFSHESEAIARRLLRGASRVRAVVASAAVALVFSGIASWATWEVAQGRGHLEQVEWLRKQADPRWPRAVGWVEAQIDHWIARQIDRSLQRS
jgi:hypothetical protein